MGITCNHYANCAQKVDDEAKPEKKGLTVKTMKDQSTLEQKIINGYDGFGGVHDNLVRNVAGGLTIFTLNNKLIVENTKTREQIVYSDASSQLSCMAVSDDFKLVAVGEGCQSGSGNARIFIYNLDTRQKIGTVNFHQKGVQTLAFSHDKKYLISCGTKDDAIVALWDMD